MTRADASITITWNQGGVEANEKNVAGALSVGTITGVQLIAIGGYMSQKVLSENTITSLSQTQRKALFWVFGVLGIK